MMTYSASFDGDVLIKFMPGGYLVRLERDRREFFVSNKEDFGALLEDAREKSLRFLSSFGSALPALGGLPEDYAGPAINGGHPQKVSDEFLAHAYMRKRLSELETDLGALSGRIG